ncbi:MAG: hypothetical protein U0264_03140 [Candidatus Kapaibacterium sp.]
MKDLFVGTVHPIFGVYSILLFIVWCAFTISFIFFSPAVVENQVVFFIACGCLLGGIVYMVSRLRRIDFDGREFILEDVRFRKTRIAASLFQIIEAPLGPFASLYKIRFTNGESYFYAYWRFDHLYRQETYYSVERLPYSIRLTKQIKQVIENEKILVVKEKSLLNITPEKTNELRTQLREVFGARPRPETLTIQHPDEPFTSRMLRRDIEAMDRNELTLEQTSMLLSHLDVLSNDGLLHLLPSMMNYIDRTTKEFATLYKKLEVLQTRVSSSGEQLLLTQTIDYLKDCENVRGMEW